MIDKIRESLFKLFNKDSFIGKIIDKLCTKEMINYFLSGILTTLVNIATFFVFKLIFTKIGWDGILNLILPQDSVIIKIFTGGSDYLDANAIAWIAGVITAFITNKIWVFESKSWKFSLAIKEFFGVLGARFFSFFVETLLLFAMVSLLSWYELLSKLIVGIIVVILNYVFSKLIIFKKKPEADKND